MTNPNFIEDGCTQPNWMFNQENFGEIGGFKLSNLGMRSQLRSLYFGRFEHMTILPRQLIEVENNLQIVEVLL
jgi:hypothetical protein